MPTTRLAFGVATFGLILTLALAAHAGVLDDALDAEAQRDFDRAADLFAAAVAEGPQERDVVLRFAHCVVEGKAWKHALSAEKALNALHEADADDVEVRLAQARLFLERAPTIPQPLFAATLFTRARSLYAELVETQPDLAEAAIGLARAHVGTRKVEEALLVLDAYLDRKPEKAAEALYWKGRILYEQARAQHAAEGGTYPLSTEVKRLYGRAQGVCLSSAYADPTVFDTWMHVAWTSQTLGDRETAHTAYERAFALDSESPLPLKGLAALHAHDPEARKEALARLEKLGPNPRRERVRELYEQVAAADWDAVETLRQAYLKDYGEDADTAYCLGKVLEARGDKEEAREKFHRALELNGEHFRAAEELDRELRKHAIQRARNSVEGARAVYDTYRPLLELAPRNPYVRNNIAFAMREAWANHKADPRWREILLLAAKNYEEAARLIGERSADDETPWATRYARAQIVNDTGVMFQIFEQLKDFERAERYYLRALDWLDGGYVDSWTYLRKIYEEQERWQELHALALQCAAALANEKGEPLEDARQAADALAKKLEAEGKATP